MGMAARQAPPKTKRACGPLGKRPALAVSSKGLARLCYLCVPTGALVVTAWRRDVVRRTAAPRVEAGGGGGLQGRKSMEQCRAIWQRSSL